MMNNEYSFLCPSEAAIFKTTALVGLNLPFDGGISKVGRSSLLRGSSLGFLFFRVRKVFCVEMY
jgi:hypothetical protein